MTPAFKRCLLAATLIAMAMPGVAAGSAQVSYLQPEKFTDAGFGSFERERTLQSLTEFFQTLGKRLPDGQTLRVEVLDIDLAGEVWPRGQHEPRVLRGRADWPTLTLRFSVLDGSRTLKTGETRLSDMNYLFDPWHLAQYGDLPYEKRMLDRWFQEAVATAAP